MKIKVDRYEGVANSYPFIMSDNYEICNIQMVAINLILCLCYY